MNAIKVHKAELLQTLTTNRGAHHQIFLEAVAGYKKQAEEMLESRLDLIRRGKMLPIAWSLPLPIDHIKDYDRIIRMVEMDRSGEIIELTEQDFSQYVMDDWAWKTQFLTANSLYSKVAADTLAG